MAEEKEEHCCCGSHDHDHGDGGCCGGHGEGHHHGHGEGGCCCGGHGGCHHGGEDRDQIAMFVVGPLETNCYAYLSGKECLVVDPGNSGAAIAEHLPEDTTLKYIVATHGHGDHVGGVRALQEAAGGLFAIKAEDAGRAAHAGEPGESGRAYDDNAPAPDLLLKDGDVLELGSAGFRVIEAPGHTPGGICLVGQGTAEHVAFLGDTLFKGSCGRTDLEGGDHDTLMASLARLREQIAPHTNLFCGHGEPTTMEDELATNPWLQPGAESDGVH